MTSRRAAATLVSLLLALPLAACDGGADGPADDEARLRAAVAAAGVTAMTPAPAQPAALVTLGQALFFDPILSGNRDIACATCHHPSFATGDGLSLSVGTGGAGLGPDRALGAGRSLIPRNAPEIFNRSHQAWRTMFWDMRVEQVAGAGLATPAGPALPGAVPDVLAAQALFPVTSADEMAGRPGDLDVSGAPNEIAPLGADLAAIWDALMVRLLAVDAYVDLFDAAFPGVAPADLTFGHAARAIAAFEATAFTFTGAPFDRWLAGDAAALGDAERRGALLFFGDAGCSGCHGGPLLTDQEAHNLCTPQVGPGKGDEAPLDLGRMRVTRAAADRFAFRTPPLRNVALTGPWMHDGAYTDLEDAVRHHLDPTAAMMGYDEAQLSSDLRGTFQDAPAFLASLLASVDPAVASPRTLSERSVQDLLAFLGALTDPAARDLDGLVPEDVPSGLPVDRL